MKTEFIKYLRKRNKKPYAVMYAYYNIEDNEVIFGYSKCHKNDEFTKKIGLEEAKEKSNWETFDVPASMSEDFSNFIFDVKSYIYDTSEDLDYPKSHQKIYSDIRIKL